MKAKDIVKDILRRKYAYEGEEPICVICDKETLSVLDEAGLIARWTDRYPGAIENHRTVCGLDLCSPPELHISGYDVVTIRKYYSMI